MELVFTGGDRSPRLLGAEVYRCMLQSITFRAQNLVQKNALAQAIARKMDEATHCVDLQFCLARHYSLNDSLRYKGGQNA